MTLEEKLDDALKGTFPASDPFWLPPENAESVSENQLRPHASFMPMADMSHTIEARSRYGSRLSTTSRTPRTVSAATRAAIRSFSNPMTPQ